VERWQLQVNTYFLQSVKWKQVRGARSSGQSSDSLIGYSDWLQAG
jgi:hypothetical protein